MDREQLDHWCERAILAVVLAIIVFAPLALGAVRPTEFLIVQGLTGLAVVLWLARIWVSPKPLVLWPPLCWAVLAAVGYVVLRYQQADLEYAARQEMIHVLVYGALFFIVISNINRQDSIQIAGFVLIGVSALISIYAIYQFCTGSNRVWHFIRPIQYAKRGSGTFINPNHLAGFLEMSLPLCLSFVLVGRFNHVIKVVLGYLGIAILVGIGVSLSRGGWLVTALMLPVFFSVLMAHRDFRLRAVIVLGLLLAIGLGVAVKVRAANSRVFELTTSGDNQEVRLHLWKPAYHIWQDNFWWGAGPAHFDHVYRQYRAPSWISQVRPQFAHNDYLNTLADYGLVGGLLLLAVFALFYLGVFRTWPHVQRAPNDLGTKMSNKSAFVLGASVGVFAILLHSMVDFNLHIPANAIVAVVLIALTASHIRFATERYWVSSRLPGRLLASGTLLVLLGYLALQGVGLFTESRWLERGNTRALSPDSRIAALKNAFATEPTNPDTVYLIGETRRLQSWEGGTNYGGLATEAMEWFRRGMSLNRFDPLNFLRYGMCLDWLGRQTEATPYFEHASRLDPNGYYVAAYRGWHAMQIEDYKGAKQFFDRSLEIFPNHTNRNSMPVIYLDLLRLKASAPASPPGIGENPR